MLNLGPSMSQIGGQNIAEVDHIFPIIFWSLSENTSNIIIMVTGTDYVRDWEIVRHTEIFAAVYRDSSFP